ncbi:Rossmann-fold NAD(P)-binding domain-containing protein [Portibacter lacus]|uniref:N-succinylornithine carbamoyltransferase n=1 Tax=Portibacter lacus TaxID=1099794 RepID=A0AA37SML9_9BACT|nr:acetylornithine carbamoyltransferase [Portibacter lacus]GLR17543.1 N-acetylornithine carbamoyltransferase [Portibacter lacus]
MKDYYSIAKTSNFKSLVEQGLMMKQEASDFSGIGKDKTLVIIFFSPSLRTRISTHKAGLKLGMHVISMNAGDGYQMEFDLGSIMNGNTAEHIKEAAKVLSQFGDMIAIRAFPGLQSKEDDLKDQVLKGFIKYATVPIINLESCLHHPLQGLADAITIEGNKKTAKPKVVLSWAPHPKALPLAVPISFAQAMNAMDYDFVVTHPQGHELPPELVGDLNIEYDQRKAFENADFVYAKSWSSTQYYGIPNPDLSWIVDAEKMAFTNNGKFMHCLPIRRNVVASDSVLDSENALIYEQAGNRVFAAQSVLHSLIEHS